MAEVKVPKLLHKMSLTAQKAWYKKQGMEMPTAAKPSEPEGKSAAAAKRVKVTPRQVVKAVTGSVRAQNLARQQGYYEKGGRKPIGAMGSGGSNVMAGAGQSTIKDLKASIKAGFNPKVSLDPYEGERAKRTGPRSINLKKESVNEAAKPDASMAMTDTLKKQMISDKDKRTLGKVAALMASQKNKDKKNEYVRQLGLKAMKAGKVDPARGHSPTRFGREVLQKEEAEQVEEGVATAQKVMDRANVVAKTNPDPKKRFAASGLAQKAMLRTINPTGVNTGIVRGGGNKTYRMLGKVPPYQLTKKTGVSEEVEQIDELKTSTLKSYLEKRPAPKIKDIARPETVGKPEERQKDIERANLTRLGRMRAKATLLKRNPPPKTPPKEDPNDRGYGQGRYMGDSVNLEGSVIDEGKMKDIATDREETSRLKAQDIFGGPVKKKPAMPSGKQLAGYRYVRNLARKAMKAGKPITETGEYNKLGQPPEHAQYLDVDPTRSDPLAKPTKKKPAQYKPGMKDGVRVRESTEVNEMKKGRLLAKAIMAKQSKHPIAQNMGEAVKDAADVGEYDYEGDMVKSQLRSILANAKRLHDMLGDQDNLPEWVQSKITLAQDYVMTAADYMEGEVNEEVEQIDELKKSTLASYVGKATGRLAAASRLQRDFEKDGHSALAGEFELSAKKKRAGIQMAANKLAKEEVVAEAEGKVAVTPKEKELAAHHGDPKKITYGDVVKARIKSAAEKAMNKGK